MPKSQFWVTFEIESVGVLYGPLVCFTAIWYILGSFGIHILPALVYCTKKSGNIAVHTYVFINVFLTL
jgi:hypothetical protein